MGTVFLGVLLFMSWNGVSAGSTADTSVSGHEVRIGLVADPQYADCSDRGPRHYRASAEKLREAVRTFNMENVDMTVSLGDLTDRNPEDLRTVISIIRDSRSPVYHVLGNHDFHGISCTDSLLAALGMKGRYYSAESGGIRMLFLDTNDISSYSRDNSRKKLKELSDMRDAIARAGAENGQNWNGGVGKGQMRWLEKELHRAGREGMPVLVFGHHPIYPATNANCLNDKELLNLLEKNSCVKAYVCGHHHPGNIAVSGTLPCITLQGMVESRGNAFHILTVRENTLELKGYGDAVSFTAQMR